MRVTKLWRTIALLGREPGLLVLQDALLNHPLINLVAVYTHGLLPKKEGGMTRPELAQYQLLCKKAEIPLQILDLPEARQLESCLPSEAFDLLIVLSWRCILPKSVLDRPRLAAINLHRGALPQYKGAEPVLRAIQAGDKSLAITAHHMTEELDEGPIIARANMDIQACPAGVDAAIYAEQIKKELYPLYAPLVRASIESLAQAESLKPLVPRAILIDLDGTLADSLSVMRKAYQLFLQQFHCEPTDSEFNSLNGPPLSEVVRRLKLSHGLQEDEELLLANYFEIVDQVYAQVKPAAGAIELLQKAREHHCTIGIVTSNTRKRTQAWLEKVHLSHLIDFIVSGEEVAQGKPHPEPYLSALKKAGCDPAETVAIEDSLQGAQSAVTAGLKTFILDETTGHFSSQAVQSISSLRQVAELFNG